MNNDNLLNKPKDDIEILENFFYLRTSTIRKNTELVRDMFGDLYQYLSSN